jgi:hypothetical protein
MARRRAMVSAHAANMAAVSWDQVTEARDQTLDREQVHHLWVPKTCATWADGLVPRSGAGRAGLGLSGDGMIFGPWA